MPSWFSPSKRWGLHLRWEPPPRIAQFGELPPGELRTAAFAITLLCWLCSPIFGAWRLLDVRPGEQRTELLQVQVGLRLVGTRFVVGYERQRELATAAEAAVDCTHDSNR